MRSTLAAGAAATLVAGAAGWLLRERTAEPPEVRTAAFELAPFEPGGPLGVAYAEQDGTRVRGWIAVWGLQPRARVGQRVAVAVRSDRPDELALRGAGLTIQVGPGTIARFSVRPRRPGRLTLTGPSTRGRPVLVVDVRG